VEETLRRFVGLPAAARRDALRRAGGAAGPAGPAVADRPVGEPARFPAAPGQEAQWFLWRLRPDGHAYHVPTVYDITGPLRADLLCAAVGDVVDRHEPLRTTFTQDGHGVVQIVHPALRPDVRVEGARSREAALIAAEAAAHRPFDLVTGPLLRVRLWRYGPDEHLLLVCAHHIIVDERSSRIIESDLAAAYQARLAGRPAPRREAVAQYADWVRWRQDRGWQDGLAHWVSTLAGAAPSVLPAPDGPPPAGPGPGALREVPLPAATDDRLRALATVCGTSPFTTLAAVFAVFLARRTGNTDVVFGTPVSGRDHPSTAAMVGYFLNTTVLRIAVDPASSFTAHARSAAEVVAGAVRHQHVPFQDVVRACRAHVEPGRNPIVDTMLVYLPVGQTPYGTHLADELTVTPVVVPTRDGDPYVTFGFVESPAGMTATVQCSPLIYGTELPVAWVAELDALLARFAADPAAPIG
jgi:hypothetical protein